MTQSISCTENTSVLECRACLQIMNTESGLFNIFESWNPPWEGMESCIAEDLAKLANIEIHQMDRHSKVICETCCQLLLSACTFTAVVQRSDQILQQRYALESQESDKIWPKPIQVDKSINNSMHDNPMNVEIKQEILSDNEYEETNGIFDSKDEFPDLDIKVEPEELVEQNLMQFQVTVNGPSSEPENPLKTEESHLTNGNCGEHLEPKIKQEPLSEEEDVDNILSDLPLECLLCAKSFNSVSGLKAHVISQHSYKSVKRKFDNSISPERKKCKYTCAICRRSFTTSTDLMVHETCHNKSVCYGCNESFDTFEQLTAHRRTCKAIASQEVKKLKTLDDVIRPQNQEQVSVLNCTLCDETFTDIYYMKIHQEIHHSMFTEQNDIEDETKMEVESLESMFAEKNSKT